VPIVDMPVGLLLERLAAAGGVRLGVAELTELFPKLGCEVEELAAMQQYGCLACGRILDRTEAQGAPPTCPSCGTDFRERPDRLDTLGRNDVIRLNMLAVRPDLFDPGGMARLIAGHLGRRTGLIAYPLERPTLTVQVDPRLGEESSLRPQIACAVLRDVRLDETTLKLVMNLQEDLHWALGRDRKLASIGVYDLDTLAGPVFHYDAVGPDELRFVPLGFPPDDDASRLTPQGILERHKTGQAYAHLLRGFTRFPILRDAGLKVLSMPPIINSEDTRVTQRTRNFFIDVTGLGRRTVDRALAVIVTSLKETLPDVRLEAVTIDGIDGRRETPDLAPSTMVLDVREAAETIGAPLDADALRALLERMGHGTGPGPRDGTLAVRVPAYRNDVMHPVDLIEDAAIAYGYDNLALSLVPTFTLGRPREIEEHAAVARRALTGLGLHQVMTLVLSSEEAAFRRWRLPEDPRAARIQNPISTEQTICRVSVLPGLLETLALNKHHDLPQSLFEVGDCCFVDEAEETGAREERMVGVALIAARVGYADVRAVLDAFVHELGRTCVVAPREHPSCLAGRAASISAPDGRRLGLIGELHPEVLQAYGLKHPVAVFELSLPGLLGVA
jgi:phenylalanyl-tRNA synthetase beta chain